MQRKQRNNHIGSLSLPVVSTSKRTCKRPPQRKNPPVSQYKWRLSIQPILIPTSHLSEHHHIPQPAHSGSLVTKNLRTPATTLQYLTNVVKFAHQTSKKRPDN